MIFERLVVGPFQTNCYLIGDSSTKEIMVVDPGDESEKIISTIRAAGFKVKEIVLTHGHGDHLGAVKSVKEAFGGNILIHPADSGMLTDPRKNLSLYYNVPVAAPAPDGYLTEGDLLQVGSMHWRIIHTPGHTTGGICLLYGDILISGDTLFAGSVGRTDFPGGSYPQLLESIKEKLMILPDNTRVYPGHGPETTIGFEKEANPFL